MNAFTQIISALSSISNNQQTPTQHRFECPNCWGRQEWDGVQCPAVDVLEKDTTTIGRAREGFIQRFARRYLG